MILDWYCSNVTHIPKIIQRLCHNKHQYFHMALNKEIDICEKISSEVRNTFLQIYNALKNRETQLLRQIEVLSQHYKLNESYDKCFKQVTIIFDNEGDMLSSISNFGRIDFNGLSSDSDVYKIEDYQNPERDHVSLYKYIENNSSENNLNKSDNAKIKSSDIQEDISNKNENILDETSSKEDKQNNVTIACEVESNSSQSNDINTNLSQRDNQSNDINTNFSKLDNQSNNNDESTSQDEPDTNLTEPVRRMSLKENDQVQAWMRQIQSEPEVEPAPSHVMEHSNITPPFMNTV